MLHQSVAAILVGSLLVLGGPSHAQIHAQSRTTAERTLDDARKQDNGIAVGRPKVYDDALLQQMLNDAEARLATLQVIDQATLLRGFGAVSGADQRTSSFGLNIQTPTLPGVQTTAKGETGTTGTTSTTNLGASGAVTGGSEGATTSSGQAVTDTVTNAPQLSPPSLLGSAPAGAFPSSFGVNSSDLLSEQMQLTFEIANLRLLLEGALSDRLFETGDLKRVKPRATIGVPIAIDADRRHKNAVAIVELEITKDTPIAKDEPSITVVLPREKTYNVAAITDSTKQIGAGVITQVVGVSGSWISGHKTYYLTRDQDTVGLTFTPTGGASIAARWQFRPVLGAEFVRPGQKQTFVQVAFPNAGDEAKFGKVKVRTYWRKLDRKKGVLGDTVGGSLKETVLEWDIPRLPLEVEPTEFDAASLEDLGGGSMLVRLVGRFLTGTYIRIGNTAVRPGTTGSSFEQQMIRFTASLADLATKRVVLVSRDGNELPLEIPKHEPASKSTDPPAELKVPKIVSTSITAFDDKNSVIKVAFEKDLDTILPSQVLIVSGKVYGYSDAPLERTSRTLSAVVPTAQLLARPDVVVTSLFAPASYRQAVDQAKVTSLLNQTERLVLLASGGSTTSFLLYGHRLKDATVLVPEKDVKIEVLKDAPDAETLGVVRLTPAHLKAHKRLVLQRPNERPVFVAIPSTGDPPAPKAPTLKERVVVGADEVTFEGEGLGALEKVMFGAVPLTSFTVASDGKSVKITGLVGKGVTTTAMTHSLAFHLKDIETPLKADVVVVSSKIETVSK